MSGRKKDIRSVVKKIHNLPTLPQIRTRIIELASDPEVSMEELSQAMSQDPPLAGRVLRVANSPFYGMSREVDSLKLALVILGISETKNIVLGLSILNILKDLDSNMAYDREKFWLHSAGCGVISRILGRKLDLKTDGADFIAGLLHDMGKIVIDEYMSEEFSHILKKTHDDEASMLEAEKELLGETHASIGAALAEEWRLPETLCDALAYHHEVPSIQPEKVLKDPLIGSLAYVAEALCGDHGIGWDGDAGTGDPRNSKAWEILLSQQDCYGVEDIDLLLNETMEDFTESNQSIQFLWE